MTNALMASGLAAIFASYTAGATKATTLAAYVSGKNFKIVIVDNADYTFSEAHDNLNDVPSVARVATSGNLANITTTGGTFDCDDITITSVTGDQSERAFLYHDSGSEATSTLIAMFDTATGLPLTPNGGNVAITISGSGLFTL